MQGLSGLKSMKGATFSNAVSKNKQRKGGENSSVHIVHTHAGNK